jgi:hypothetical protein
MSTFRFTTAQNSRPDSAGQGIGETGHGAEERKAERPALLVCGCCGDSFSPALWDSLYGSCNRCAVEASLGAFPCDHGKARWGHAVIKVTL